MSNPPFGSPLYSEEDDFSFPCQPIYDDDHNNPINFPPLIQDQNTNLPNTSSQPMLEHQDLSIFLQDHDQDYALIGQYDDLNIQETINWPISPIEQVGPSKVVVEDSSLGYHDMQYYGPAPATATAIATTTATATTDDRTAAAVGGGVGEGSTSKKLDHNAKEKVRRLKLNETYLTLRSLLPDSRRAKKKWSAPYIIDRALEYVPQLQSEIEKLTLEKNNMLSALGKKQRQIDIGRDDHESNKVNKTLTLSINEVKKGEVIVQICEHNNKIGIMSNLIGKLEGQGMQVLGASSQHACQNRSCFHLHVQMGEKPVEADYVAVLYKKIISWLS